MSARALPAAIPLAVLSLAVSAHAAPLFKAPALLFDTRDPPVAVAIADLDADGRLDAAVVASGGVAVFRGNGDGTFGARTDFETGHGPNSVAIADLNRDGRPDLVTANHGYIPYTVGSVSVLLGNGDGTFQPKLDFDGGPMSRSVTVGDLDGDGRLDLAVANTAAVSVLLGNGDGTFAARTAFATAPESPAAVAIGDLNRDGRPDLVAANGEANPDYLCPEACAVSVLLGNGDGTFGPSAGFGTGERCRAVAIADFNRDGRPDVVSANSYDRSTTVSVHLGRGDGTFWDQRDFTTNAMPVSIAVADFDVDGRLDMAVVNGGGDPDFDSNSISVLLGDGLGGFRTAGEFIVAENPGHVGVGDLDADGRLDLCAANGGSKSLSVLLGNGDGTFGTSVVRTPGYPSSVAIADLDGDGRQDLAIPSTGSYPGLVGVVSIRLGNGDGTYRVGRDFGIGTGSGAIAVGDLNADAKPDLVVTNGSVSVLLGNGDGTFAPVAIYGAGVSPGSVAISDLDGDSRSDLAVANAGASPTYVGSVSVLRGNGDGTFAAATSFAAGLEPQSVVVADFDADGRLDLVVANPPSNTVSVLRGNGDGTFGIPAAFPTGRWPRSVAVADLDGDARLDLAVGTDVGSVLLGNGDDTFARGADFAPGYGAFSVAIADFDGDGRSDIAGSNDALGGEISAVLGVGDGTFGSRAAFGAGWYPRSVALGDLDGDRRPDVVTANFNSKTVSLYLGNTRSTARVRSPRRVPAAPGMALAGFQPNPARETPTVSFALADESPATIEVLDLAGRRVMCRDLPGLGAGRHAIRLEGAAALAPGVYVVKLRQAGRTLLTRGAVLR